MQAQASQQLRALEFAGFKNSLTAETMFFLGMPCG